MIDYGTLYTALIGYGLVGTLGSILLAPFWRGRRSDAHWLPIALGAASLLGGLLGNRSKAKAAEEDRKMALANEQARAAAVQNMLAQLKARGVDIYGPQTTTDKSSTTTTTNEQLRKVVDPKTRNLLNKIIAQQESEMERDIFGPAQLAQLARETGRVGDVGLNNLAASRQLSPAQLGAMKMMSLSSRTAPVLEAKSKAPGVNAAYRAGIRGEGMGVVNSLMGENRSGVTQQDMTGTRTGGPDLQSLLALSQASVPQQISTKTGYNPWAQGMSAAGDLTGALYSIYGDKKKQPADYGSVFGTPGKDLYIPRFP